MEKRSWLLQAAQPQHFLLVPNKIYQETDPADEKVMKCFKMKHKVFQNET